MTTQLNIPLNKLHYGSDRPGGSINSRQEEVSVRSLLESIKRHGLLVPLVVRKNGAEDDYYVIDGNRRLEALKQIYGDAAEPGVMCVEKTDGDALELSMVANIDRAPLHLVDQFEVFGELVKAGRKVDDIAKAYGMKVPQVRQALALAKMAPEVREAWRAGEISAETAEAFTLTADHELQANALKKLPKHPAPFQVERALIGDTYPDIAGALKYVGRKTYEKLGFEVNESLFGEERDIRVTDLPALMKLVAEKLDMECESYLKQGWKWAKPVDAMPADYYAWQRVWPEGGKYTKDVMAECGVVLAMREGETTATLGVVDPTDRRSVPKTEKQKQAETATREERKEATGGLSNALAERLGKQMTAAIREAMAAGLANDVIYALAVACLASDQGPSEIRLGTAEDLERHNDFAKYLKLALDKTPTNRAELLALWLGKSIEVKVARAEHLAKVLHPGKEDDKALSILVKQIDQSVMRGAMFKHFDREDYFNSVNRELVMEAIKESLGKEAEKTVRPMKGPELKAWAIKHVKKDWLPKPLRIKQ